MFNYLKGKLGIYDLIQNQNDLINLSRTLIEDIKSLQESFKNLDLDKIEKTSNNFSKINEMLLELKGIASMARASIKNQTAERKKKKE